MSKYALLIGSNYPGTPYPLQGCLNDVNFLKSKLAPSFSVTQLTDGTPLKPTRTNVLNAFADLLKKSKSGDTLFFGYSGHGSNIFDASGDEKDQKDEVLVTCEQNFITDDELKAVIDANMKKNTRLFCVFDSCYSGSILDLQYKYFDADNFNKTSINPQYKTTRGQVIMISGSKDSQTSADATINGTKRGAMLWAFLQVINQTPKCKYSTLLQNMRSLLKKSNFTQVPQLSAGQPLDMNSFFNFF